MKKIITVIFFLLVIQSAGYTQDLNAESDWRDNALHGLDTAKQDTSRVLIMADLAGYYKYYAPDSTLFYGYKALALARQIKFPRGEVSALETIYFGQLTLGNDSKALETTLRGLKIAERNNLVNDKAFFLCALSHVYNRVKDYTKALDLSRKSKVLFDSLHDFTLSATQQNYIGETYLMMNQLDSALYYCQSAYENAARVKVDWLIYQVRFNLGKIQLKKGNTDLALAYFRQSLLMAWDIERIFNAYFSLAQLYQQINKLDSCIYYAKKSLETVQGRAFYSHIINASTLLSGMYEKRDPQRALQYGKIAASYKDSLYNLGTTTSFANFAAFDEQERQYEIETANTAYRSQVKQYILIGSLSVFLLIAFILYRLNKIRMQHEIVLQKQKASELEMQALRAQMNPHFIFNCLSSINHFILKNESERASDYLTKFSRLIRMVLNNSKKPLISLEEELEMLRLYIELEKLRFKNSFDYSVLFQNSLDASSIFIPPLVLQPFAENAIWHGLMNKAERGILQVVFSLKGNMLYCTIADNGIGREKAQALKSQAADNQRSMGMQITTERLTALSDDEDQTICEIEDLMTDKGKPAGTKVIIQIKYLESVDEAD